jgi:Zn-dependent M28 family amino/carboxypeptidase
LIENPMNTEHHSPSHWRAAQRRADRKFALSVAGWLTRMFLLIAIPFAGWVAVVVQPFVAPVASEAPPADPARLEAHVKYLSEDLFPRSADRFENTERAVRYIHDVFDATGARVSTQDVMIDGIAYKNVIAKFGPGDGAVIVVGAHYDSFGDEIAGAMHPEGFTVETHTPGADDNASGVAGLIELAGMLGKRSPSRPIELVAYASEEPPYFRTSQMGSFWHARELAASGRDVELMLSLEMIGYFSDAPGSQAFPFPGMQYIYSDRADFITLIGKFGDFGKMRRAKALMSGGSSLPVYSMNAPVMLPGIDFSDHRSYWPHDIPAIMVTDTAYFRNPNYHRAGDRYDTLDYRRMALTVQAVYALAIGY